MVVFFGKISKGFSIRFSISSPALELTLLPKKNKRKHRSHYIEVERLSGMLKDYFSCRKTKLILGITPKILFLNFFCKSPNRFFTDFFPNTAPWRRTLSAKNILNAKIHQTSKNFYISSLKPPCICMNFNWRVLRGQTSS